MFFNKNEVIELENKKNYLILGTMIVENEVYYQIQEINEEGTNVVGKKSFVVAINDNGNLFVEDVVGEEKLSKLQELFTS